ncbi:Glycerol-3-phosphate acyltransferase 3-like, variant 2 [Parelaphostrongylus tenuis]|uniref:Glycerol-3-phosphate acyltransferase 3-like, variant 2 n=1 Tax=Parelaphostrongylus tenuis TaxID=148309 RepID=A0AAD5N1F3_PARTN|nr:Glycerol-3-phosphate acyltransferase 3-like, variant 2 [Parelaphostrongylus tenuis]
MFRPITAGIEAIIEDQVTSRFRAEQLSSWNLLTRTRYSFQYINWRLTLLWATGFLFRYLILVPIRIVLFLVGLIIMCSACYTAGIIPNPKVKKFINRQVMLVSMRIFSRSFSSIIRFHDQENRAKKGGICVANHTSPIDVMVLSCDNCYAMIGQKQGGLLGFIQNALSRAEHHIWFERSEAADRRKVVQRLKEHVDDENKLPIIIFPEGTCINNTSVMMFKKGSFEIGSTIYPIAMKYDSRLTDAFWNSSEQSYGEYLWRMMTSWAIICDVWYLPPMTREDGEDAIAFARRVKRAIAKKGGLVDLEWDGALKRERVSSKLVQLQQKLYYDRLKRTTTINSLSEEDLGTDILDIMTSISEEDRNSLMKQLDETDDDAAIMRKVSAYGHNLRKLSDSVDGAVVHHDSKKT